MGGIVGSHPQSLCPHHPRPYCLFGTILRASPGPSRFHSQMNSLCSWPELMYSQAASPQESTPALTPDVYLFNQGSTEQTVASGEVSLCSQGLVGRPGQALHKRVPDVRALGSVGCAVLFCLRFLSCSVFRVFPRSSFN